MKYAQIQTCFFLAFCCCFSISACKPPQIGGDSLSPPSPSVGGTISNFSLTDSGLSGQKVNIQFTINCPADDYVICNLNVFNSKVSGQYPLIYSATYSYHCSALSMVNLPNVPCQTPCIGETCVWITLICSNTTKGTLLQIDDMPPNISCV